jgi:hypothetical protein
VAPVAAIVCAWKIATELLYPISGARGGIFEFVERASGYAAPLALICVSIIAARLASGADQPADQVDDHGELSDASHPLAGQQAGQHAESRQPVLV